MEITTENNQKYENKFLKVLSQSQVETNEAKIKAAVEKIIDEKSPQNRNIEVYKKILNCIDLTTLSTSDSEKSVAAFTKRVNDFGNNHPDLPNVAAICVYANFAAVVRENLEESNVGIAVCSANFPSSQARLEVKCAETALAIADGANEVDIVFNHGYFNDESYQELADEISEIKETTGKERTLKVILETGLLATAEKIKRASILAMYSGADFIKTSTGKIYPGATPEAAYVMCQCIREYYKKTGTMIGFKASGGVRTTEDAVIYYTIVKEVLGDKWLNNEHFRIGASSLANNILADITGVEEKEF